MPEPKSLEVECRVGESFDFEAAKGVTVRIQYIAKAKGAATIRIAALPDGRGTPPKAHPRPPGGEKTVACAHHEFANLVTAEAATRILRRPVTEDGKVRLAEVSAILHGLGFEAICSRTVRNWAARKQTPFLESRRVGNHMQWTTLPWVRQFLSDCNPIEPRRKRDAYSRARQVDAAKAMMELNAILETF